GIVEHRVCESAQEEPRTSGEHGEAPSAADLRHHMAGEVSKAAGVEALVRVDQVEAVVGHERPLGRRGLGSANVHTAVDLAGIHRYYLSAYAASGLACNGRLAFCCGSGDD